MATELFSQIVKDVAGKEIIPVDLSCEKDKELIKTLCDVVTK